MREFLEILEHIGSWILVGMTILCFWMPVFLFIQAIR